MSRPPVRALQGANAFQSMVMAGAIIDTLFAGTRAAARGLGQAMIARPARAGYFTPVAVRAMPSSKTSTSFSADLDAAEPSPRHGRL